MESGFLSWIKQIRIRINESKEQYITNPTEFRLFLETEGYYGKYDGKSHSIHVKVSKDCTVQYSTDKEIWSTSVPKFVDVCDTVCYVRVTRNKRIEETVVPVKIFPRSLVLVSESVEKEYDGLPLFQTDVLIQGDGIASNDRFVCRGTGRRTVVGKSINKIEYGFENSSVEKNYAISLQEGIISILDRKIKPTLRVKFANELCTYDGECHKYSFRLDKNIDYNGLKYHIFGISGQISAVDAGEYSPKLSGTICIEDEDGQDVSKQFNVTLVPGNLQIQQRSITLKSGSAEKEYDGLPLICNDIEISGDGLIEKDELVVSAIGNQSLVGSILNEIIYRFANEKVEKNYCVDTIAGTLKVVDRKSKFRVYVRGKSDTFTYDGTMHSVEGFEDDGFMINGHRFSVSGITSSVAFLHAGTVDTKIAGKPVVTDEKGNDVSEQFDVHIFSGILRILSRKVKIVSGSARRSYNGCILENHKVDILEDGFCIGEEPLVCVSGKQCIVGKCINIFTYTFPEYVHQEDYSISTEYGILEVLDRENKYEIDLHFKSKDILYDGNEHSVWGIEEEQIEVNGNIYTIAAVCYPNIVVKAGTYIYDEPVNISVFDSEKRNVSEQFRVNIIPGTISVRKRTVLLTSESITKEYDGIPLSGKQIIISGDGFAKDEGIEAYFNSEQLLPGSLLNEFSYVPFANTDIENYEIRCINGVLTVIDRIKPFEVTVHGENREYLYDGEEKTLPEFSHLDVQINGCGYFVKGITNIVAGIEEGRYTQNEFVKPCVYDSYNNDVSGQFNVSVIPGILTIQHNPEYDRCSNESKIDEYDIAIHEIIQKMSGESDAEEVIKKYTRKELEALYHDTKELLNFKGTVEPKYENLLKEQAETDVLAILHNRIVREFKNVTLLSEIEINDREFDLLMYYLKRKYLRIKENFKRSFVDILFSVAMVQIGIRYYENNFWPQVAKAADIDEIDQMSRGWVGRSVTDTLLAFGKPVYSKNEYVTNIMMHCFITDTYSGRFFDYLFQYYRIDLERDISGFQDMDLEYICESIVNPYSKRKQLLSEYAAMSIRAAREYCKDIILKTLRMIDCSFWDEEYNEQYLTGRLARRFEEWKEQSEFYQSEKRKSRKDIIKDKCIRQFRKPHLECDFEAGKFNIILPTQMIPVSVTDELPVVKWFVVSRKKWDFQCYLSDGYSGYKTEEIRIWLDPEDIFQKYVFLLFTNDVLLRSFVWDEKKAQFFEENGRWVAGEHIEPGRLFAFVSADSYIKSEALMYEGKEFGLKYYELNLHDHDFVLVQGEENYYVGKIPAPGLSDNYKIMGITISLDEKAIDTISVYSKFPELIVEVEEGQYRGTAVIVNGTVNKLSQMEFVDVHAGKTSDKKYYFIFTEKLQGIHKGYNKILVDYPNSQKRLFVEYYILSDFSYKFVGSPYIYRDNGILRVNRNVINDKIYLDCKQNDSDVLFKMSELEDGMLTISAEDDILLHFTVPMLLVSWDRKEWKYEQLEDIWHSDLENMVYIRYPSDIITLYVDGENANLSRCCFRKRVDGIFDCDLTKLKSYFSETKVIEKIGMEVKEQRNGLFKIIQKSIFLDVKLSVNPETNGIDAKLDILGKGTYFADLFFRRILLIEKEPVPEDMIVHFDIEADTADYTVKVFEAEDFCFDEEYQFVGEKKQTLINTSDLVGCCMKVKNVRSNDSHILSIADEYVYYLFLENKTSCNTYDGILTAVFHESKVTYASKAWIEISNASEADRVRIKRPKTEDDFDFFVFDSDKEAILDVRYMYGKKERYTLLDPEHYFCSVDYVSPNTKTQKDGYEWIEDKEKNRKRKFSIWKD